MSGETFKRFGLFLTPEQCVELLKLYQLSTGPLMGVSYRHTKAVAQKMDRARADYHTKLDEYAQALGLPKPRELPDLGTNHYGIDFGTGEILGTLDEEVSTK